MPSYRKISCFLTLALLVGCSSPNENQEWSLDSRSYHLGAIGAFSEMVEMGVKELALSAPLEPAEMDAIVEEATNIAARHNVPVFREDDFVVTDLFAAELTEGKHVLLICRQNAYDVYENIKAEKERLVGLGEYEGLPRERLARRMGELLGYPDVQIDRLIAENGN